MNARVQTTLNLLARIFLIPCVVVVVALPSWTASARDFTMEEARARYLALDEAERLLIHERYAQFSSLDEVEREDLRRRARNLARITAEVESQPLPPAVEQQVQKLSPRKRREFERDLLAADLKERGLELRSKLPETTARELQQESGPRQRAAYMRRFKHQNMNRVVREMVKRQGKRLGMAAADVERVLALPRGERWQAFLDFHSDKSEEEILSAGLPFGIRTEQWRSWQELSDEQFFAQIVKHREAMSRLNEENQGAREFEKPEPKQLTGLVNLLAAARKRMRDFVRVADVSREERRDMLRQRKRDLCFRYINNGELMPYGVIEEMRYMSGDDFSTIVRRILMKYGGPDRILEWASEDGIEPEDMSGFVSERDEDADEPR